MIINHQNPVWRRKQSGFGKNAHNGAKYYSQEICERIIPNVKTNRNWVTVNVPGLACDHAIVFIHSNINAGHYEWLSKYKDLVLVCGIPETVEKVSHLGTAIYLPLSIDVDYVKRFALPEEKRSGVAYVGREAKTRYDGVRLPWGIDHLEGMPRDELLMKMAQYESVYAVGRTALEAKALGLNVLPYDPRFPDPSIWEVMDNLEAAKILQEKIDEIDGGQMIFNHDNPIYKRARQNVGKSKWNGAYYYSIEICDNIIPKVKTDRSWITLNFKDKQCARDHAIVFVHNHRNCPECYEWLTDFDDLIFVCSEEPDIEKLEKMGREHGKNWKGILLPLSVDVHYVKQFRRPKTKDVAFCGRKQRQEGQTFPNGTDFICGLPRQQLLAKMAEYRKIYATDRCAIEGLILGCEILPFDPKHPDPTKWKILDNEEAAEMLQEELNKIDGQAAETEGTGDHTEEWSRRM